MPALVEAPDVAVPVALRLASVEDTGAILRLLFDAATRSPYTGGAVLDRDGLTAHFTGLIANSNVGFLIAISGADVCGVLGLMLYDDLISSDRLAAQICWYVAKERRDGTGIKLLSYGEEWAKQHGVTRIQMVAPAPKFNAVFTRRGYVATHRVYERRL